MARPAPMRMVARGFNLVMAVLVVAAAAAAAPPKVKTREDVLEALASVEERVRALENLWNSLDRRLQQDTNKIDSLHIKLDRLEGLMSGRAHQAQLAADRAASTCQHLQTKFNMQQVGETIRGGRSSTRETPAGAETPHKGDYQHKINAKDADVLEQRRQTTMQQDMSSSFNKESMQVSNMYKDLWRRSLVLEGMVKDSMTLTNASRRESYDGLRSLMIQFRRSCPSTPNQYNVDHRKENLNNFIQRKFLESQNKMELKFKEIISAQNLFTESCHRIQMDEPQLETEVTRVLEKLLDTFMNKTAATNKDLQTIQGLIRYHDANIIKAVSRVTTIVSSSGRDFKALTHTVTEKCRHQDNQLNELTSFGRKLDTLLTFLQELQEEMTYNENRKIETMTKTSGSKMILNEISKEIHKAMKNATDGAVCPKLDNTERDSLIEKLSSLVKNLQDLTEQLSRDDDEYVKYDENLASDDTESSFDSEYESESDIKLTPEELIKKLNNINSEKSPEVTTANETTGYEQDTVRRKNTNRKEVKRKDNLIHHKVSTDKHDKDLELEWKNLNRDDVYYKSGELSDDYDDELIEPFKH